MSPLSEDDPASILTTRFYSDLRDIAGRLFATERDGGRSGHTLQPTAIVNEACMRIMSSGLPEVPREQRLALAGRVLKQVLIDHSRARNAAKRGGGRRERMPIEIEPQVLADGETVVDFEALHAALERLAHLSPRQADVVTLRVLSGLTMEQVASVLGVSKRSAEADWTVARAWLRRDLAATTTGEEAT